MSKLEKFDDMFKILTIALLFNRSHPSVRRNMVWVVQFGIILSITLFCAFLLLYSVLFHDIRTGKFSEASKNCCIFIVSVTITLKYSLMLRQQENIKQIISIVERDFEAANLMSDEEKKIVLHYAERGDRVCKYWLVFGYGTSVIFPIKAFTLMFYSHWVGENSLIPMFDLTYPPPIEDNKNVPVVFWSLFLLCIMFGTYAGSMYAGFDPLVPIFMLHTCGQLELLSRCITKVFTETDDLKKVEENLKQFVMRLQELYKLAALIKSNFSIIYEYVMKSTTFLLPLTAYQIIEGLRDKEINVEFISFFVGCILHFYVPCYYSDLLMETSESLRQAIYSCGWEKCPSKRIRQIILFMLTRARVPMCIRTVFYVVNLDTFAEMCRHSYGILNLMNAAWE